jgi:LPXTG-motif cell wall-anchored protein
MLLFYTSDSEARSETMTQGTVQLVAGILALVLVGIIIMRRKNKKKEEDDF